MHRPQHSLSSQKCKRRFAISPSKKYRNGSKREKLPWSCWRVALAGSGACWEVVTHQGGQQGGRFKPSRNSTPHHPAETQLRVFPENCWKSQSQEALGPPRLTVTGFWPQLCNYCVLCTVKAKVPSFLIKKKNLSQNCWGLALVPQTIVNVYRKLFPCTDCLYDTHSVKYKMRSPFSKLLLGPVVETVLHINPMPGLKELEGNQVTSSCSPLPPGCCWASPRLLCSPFKKSRRKESLTSLTFKFLTQLSWIMQI